MLIVTGAQRDALEEGQYRRFEHTAAEWLREHFPDDCHMLGENRLRERIRYGVQVGARYGLYAEPEALKFLFISFLLAPDFDLRPEWDWIRAMLLDPQVEPATKMRRIFDELARRFEASDG